MENDELIKRCFRIFYIARKPTDDEFQKVARVTIIGMVLFGVVGLVINFIFTLFNLFNLTRV